MQGWAVSCPDWHGWQCIQHYDPSQARLLSMQASMEVLSVEWKLVKDDLHRLRAELAERSTRLSKLRAKHETLLAKHGQSAEEQDKLEVLSPACIFCMRHACS